MRILLRYHQAGEILRKILIIGILAATAIPSQAAKRMNAAKLERLLSADIAAHKQDAEIAQQIQDIVLTERMPAADFAQLQNRFGSGSQTSAALQLLADESQFLESAPTQATAEPAPDSVAQAHILDVARNYVSKTLQRLPNFLSTCIISRYDDTPHADKPGDWPTRTGLHLVATAQRQTSLISDRDHQPAAQGSAAWRPGTGLVSGGEFGSSLGMVLADISKGQVSWSHWQRSSAGVLAVFRYSVPASASHFEVFSSFRQETSTEGVKSAPNSRGISTMTIQPSLDSNDVQLVSARPAYQGSIWVSPADGVVYRITMETDTKMGLRILRRAAILVEYGPVKIAGKTYICPVRSLAEADAVTTTESRLGDDATEWLNESVFTDYHRFGSSVRILGEEAEAPSMEAPPSVKETAVTSAAQGEAQNSNSNLPARSGEENAPAPPQAQSLSNAPPASAPTVGATALEAGANESKTLAASLPVSSASAPAPEANLGIAQSARPMPGPLEAAGMTLQLNVNSLLVPAVVLDKSGRAVGDLAKADFFVTDNGKRRKIIGLTLVKRAPVVARVERNSGVRVAAKIGADSESTATGEPRPQQIRYLVFLFDDRHLNVADLQIVKKAASKLFEHSLPEGEYADVLSLMGASSGITRDNAALRAAVIKLTVHEASQNVKENCPNVDYFSANQILRFHIPEDFQLAVQNARQCSMLQDPPSSSEDLYNGISNPDDPFQRAAMRAAENALATGDEDARESLLSVRNVLLAMTKLPGQRILILVSPGFLTLSEESKELESEILDEAAEAEVTVNALDARGLAGANFDASQGGTSLGLITGQLGQERIESSQAKEGALSELAAGTGGRFFHDNNDLQSGLQSLAAAPDDLYLLEISLQDVKANGAYHQLRVKVDRPGLEVLARKGYVAPRKPSSKKSK
jgi:VWFA-related protein